MNIDENISTVTPKMLSKSTEPIDPESLEKSPELIQKFYESNAGDGTTTSEQHLRGIQLYVCLIACYLCSLLIQIDQTIVFTILEEVGNKFNAYDKIGWISSGYLLTMCVFSATWGRLSIIFVRKWSLVASVVLFEAGSLMCGLASSMNILIGGRVLAGVGGGGIQTLGMVIVSELTTIDKRPLVMASMGVTSAVGTVAGPLIGGAFASADIWRWCFYINLPIGGVALAALLVFFKPPRPRTTLKEKLRLVDYTGTILVSGGIVLILLGLTCGGNEFEWDSAPIIVFFILGGVLLVIFCIWNFKFSKFPIIPAIIVKTPLAIMPILAGAAVFFCFMGSLTYMTVYFQIIKSKSAWKSGISLIPLILSTIVAAIISGVATKKTGLIKPITIFGGICGCVGFGLLQLLNENSSNSATIGLLILPGVYSGLAFQTLMISTQLEAPKAAGSTILVTSLMNFARGLGGALGTDISQLTFNNSFKTQVKKQVAKAGEGVLTVSEASSVLSKPELMKDMSKEAKKIVEHCFITSFKNVFWLALGVSLLSFLLILFTSNRRLPQKHEIGTNPEDDLKKEITNTS